MRIPVCGNRLSSSVERYPPLHVSSSYPRLRRLRNIPSKHFAKLWQKSVVGHDRHSDNFPETIFRLCFCCVYLLIRDQDRSMGPGDQHSGMNSCGAACGSVLRRFEVASLVVPIGACTDGEQDESKEPFHQGTLLHSSIATMGASCGGRERGASRFGLSERTRASVMVSHSSALASPDADAASNARTQVTSRINRPTGLLPYP